MNNKIIGHTACFTAYLIFGINIIICKDLANSKIISPLGLFCFRAVGAALLFWIISFFMPKEKVDKKDLIKIIVASMLGLFLTQITFLKAITMTTPLDTSILTSGSPIFTMFVAAIALKEPITWKKGVGVLISFCGIIMLILNSVSANGGVTETKPLGVILMLSNSLCFAMYLGIFRPIISKYSVITFMKWMFLFSTIVSLPLEIKSLILIDYINIPLNYYLELGFLIVFSTFIAYFLVPIGQKILRPTVISLYSYLQPIIASIISIWIGMDIITWQKIIAAVAVVCGAVLVNKSRAAITKKQ
jgi:Permeases of the drug/metabolite transporter (DMT) superfamily